MALNCEICHGSGKTGPVHINRGENPHEWRDSMPCEHCDGTGLWSEGRWEQWSAGKAMRSERMKRGESLLAASRRLGVSPSHLCALEFGRPSPKEDADHG